MRSVDWSSIPQPTRPIGVSVRGRDYPTIPVSATTTTVTDDVEVIIRHLPESARIAAELGSALQRDDIDFPEISAALQRDPALTRAFLAAANSPAYAGAQTVDSVDAAMTRLGQRETFHVAGAVAMTLLYAERLALYNVPPTLLRQEAIFTALLMEQLAPTAGVDPFDAFTTGLLHGAGKVVLNALAVHTFEVPAYAEGAEPLGEWEEQTLGYRNPDVAGRAAHIWSLPEPVVDALSAQYGPTSTSSVLAHLLSIATAAAHLRGHCFPGETEYCQVALSSYVATHLTEAAVAEAVARIERSYERLNAAIRTGVPREVKAHAA
jgi:HD-like signal output (HDOD) protein